MPPPSSGHRPYYQGQPKNRPFDSRWQYPLALTAKVLRDIQETWARSSRPFPSEAAAAVVLQTLAARPVRYVDEILACPPSGDDWVRPVEDCSAA